MTPVQPLRIRLISAVALVLTLCTATPAALAKATAGRLVVATDGTTVYDNKTKLTWQRTPPAGTYDWAGAKSYCASNTAGLAGAGWRLPGVKELLSIVDRKQYNPAIDTTAFPNTPAEWFWSATPFKGGSSFAWGVDFDVGVSDGYVNSIAYDGRVRCVR